MASTNWGKLDGGTRLQNWVGREVGWIGAELEEDGTMIRIHCIKISKNYFKNCEDNEIRRQGNSYARVLE